MIALGLVTAGPHPPEAHDHKPFVNPCHDALKPTGVSTGDGSAIVEFTPRGRQRAADIIRRHRLAERLFTDSLAMDSETEIEQQACKFEHILSPEATDKICSFLAIRGLARMARRFRPGRVADGNRKWRQHLSRIHIEISALDSNAAHADSRSFASLR